MDSFFLALISAGVGVAGGAAAAYLWEDRRARQRIHDLQTLAAVTEQKLAALTDDAAKTAAETAGKVASLTAEIARERAAADQIRGQLAHSAVELAQARAELDASRSNIGEQKLLLDQANDKLTQAFAAVSQEALAKGSAAFLEMAKAKFETLSAEATGTLDQRKEQIATLLKPLEESLAGYQKRLAEVESSRTNAYGELLKQIGGMSVTQQTLAAQTTHLVTALKKSTVRGRWGEIALQRLAEMSGMTEHIDFSLQQSTVTDDGRLLRPDMIVKLPGDRCVVVDSKAVMNAFLDAIAATDDAARAELMKVHARNVRSRITDLAGKNYWSQFATAPEFVVLFLPGEAFLYAACEADPDLIQFALGLKVLLATPTTFIGLLQTIERGWRHEALTENAEEIRRLGTDIFDRLVTLADNMGSLGKSLDSAVDHYNKTVGTLESRVLVSARKIGELGAHTDRPLEEPETVDKKSRKITAELQRSFPFSE